MSIIKAMNLKKYYITDTYEVRALDGVSLVVEEREFIAVVGTSGCGKTTLMNILGGLDVPDSGALWIKNTSLKDLSKEQRTIFRRRNIGFVFQQFHLIDEYTVKENILLSFLYSDQQPDIEYIDSLLQDLGLIDKMNEYPSHLSGGQKQRVALIRALAHKPRFLIADEPTGAIDEKNRNEILQILQNLNHSGTTIIVVTHDEFVASHCRTRYRMKNGYLTSEGEGLHEV